MLQKVVCVIAIGFYLVT